MEGVVDVFARIGGVISSLLKFGDIISNLVELCESCRFSFFWGGVMSGLVKSGMLCRFHKNWGCNIEIDRIVDIMSIPLELGVLILVELGVSHFS